MRGFRSVGFAACVLLVAPTGAVQAEERPNVLLIVADDLGWRDVGYHGSEIQTPNIDRLAKDGVELDRFYAQPSCSPMRTALMTGKSPLSLGIHRPISKNERGGLPLTETILPEYLAQLDYQTALVGKWHLGHYSPEQFPHARGFDHFYGSVTGGIGYWDHNHGGGHDWQRNGKTLREDGYTTRLVTEEALRWLEASDEERPVFLFASFHAPHMPNEAPQETIDRYGEIEDPNRRVHAAMVSELDDAIGRLLDAFARRGLLQNTIVLFVSDNGGATGAAAPPPLRRALRFLGDWWGRPLPFVGLEFAAESILDTASDNRPLPKGKGSVAEGGVRVPGAIWWPGHLEGGTHEGFLSASDLLPTLLEAIGAPASIPDDLHGRSQWRALRGEAPPAPPDYVVYGIEGVALYRPPWKLVDPDAPRLYQVYDDPYEERDVAAEHPELVSELVEVAQNWPVGPELDRSYLEIFMDPDFFGGPEDREPWADVARDRAVAAAEG